ncbi:actin cytoskeleton-regulatory complex protein PAN1-like [Zingiber officinale]|uniref:actin cytoskeleton-regulatory complex protein PAN1-like n=1 Tax=Zingiber officinale TaxID=94328 RepID=UPI001C4AEDB8|nr:actin cytoskeleton-regulatory complex protein PAN1-like [Zingiber officinale]
MVRKPPTNFDMLINQATEFINVEEAQLSRKKKVITPTPIPTIDCPMQPPPPPRGPLAGPQICHQEPQPQAVQHGEAREAPQRWCTYHRASTHNTEECYTLKRQNNNPRYLSKYYLQASIRLTTNRPMRIAAHDDSLVWVHRQQDDNVGEVKGDQLVARKCYVEIIKTKVNGARKIQRMEVNTIQEKPSILVYEEKEEIQIQAGRPEVTTQIATNFAPELKTKLVESQKSQQLESLATESPVMSAGVEPVGQGQTPHGTTGASGSQTPMVSEVPTPTVPAIPTPIVFTVPPTVAPAAYPTPPPAVPMAYLAPPPVVLAAANPTHALVAPVTPTVPPAAPT